MLNVYEKIFLQTKILMTNKKIYLNKASEGWIVDRFRKEWYQNQKEPRRSKAIQTDRKFARKSH